MKPITVCLVLLMLPSAFLWAQGGTQASPAPAVSGPEPISEPMLAPPPVSGQAFPTSFTSEERSNYLRGGLAFTTAYTDNAIGSLAGHPVSDVGYSVAPMIALDETTPRMHTVLSYAPGFTFYQRENALNEQDQNAAIDFSYRLSPHVTFSARDSFQKSSNIFNQPNLAASTVVSGDTQSGNFSVIAPIADRLSNSGNVGLTYQFAANAMVGASGTFTNLHYPDQAQVPGLSDSSSQAGLAFYALRISRKHYVGVTYQYQRLLAYPVGGQNETQTHAALFFYSFYPTSKVSFSVFGGPQFASASPQFSGVSPTPTPASKSWNPAAGGSVNWQSRLSVFAASYSRLIANGGGLIGAVQLNSGTASFRQQLTRTLNGTVAIGYAQNDLLTPLPELNYNGHTLSGTAALQQQFRQHVTLQLGYTRLHQDYSGVQILATAPDTNREFVSVSYQFSRALGR